MPLKKDMGKRFDLVAFDMDGVLFNHRSSWAWIHEQYGVDNEESLRAFVMNEIDEKEFMRRDIKMWKDIDPNVKRSDLIRMFHDMPLIKGIQETVATLHWNDIKCVIISGGIDIAAEMIANEFEFDDFSANSFETDADGTLLGEGIINVDLRDKGATMREYIEKFGTVRERTVSIGNSYTDISMFESSGMGIAFNPTDKETETSADHTIFSDNISDVLDVILFDLKDGV